MSGNKLQGHLTHLLKPPNHDLPFKGTALLAGGLLLLWLIMAAAQSPEPVPWCATARDPRFGWVEAYKVPDVAAQSRVAWQRVRFHWAEVQPDGPEQWLPAEITEAEIAAEVAAKRELVGLLIGLPGWAADDNRLPQGLWLDNDDPGNLWANYVRAAVTRYRGQIDHWVVWNEPDVWDSGHPGHTFDGDERDFARLLQVAYQVAKQANPEAVIHLPGLSHYWDANFGRELYLRRLLAAIEELDPQASEQQYYFDAATMHLYFDPLANYQLLQDYTRLLRENGLDQPVWLTETNAPPSLDPVSGPLENPAFVISLEEQAAYVPQMMALSLAAEVEQVAIYVAIDPIEGADPEPFGLIRQDGSARPAQQTFATAACYLGGATAVTAENNGTTMQIRLEQPNRTTYMLWTLTDVSQTVRLTPRNAAPVALKVDAYGKMAWLRADVQGRYLVTLPAAECNQEPCHIGGAPVYLVTFDLND